VLAPEQVGLTTQEQPSLFWYQSRPSEAKFELTVLEENRSTPLLHVKLDRAVDAGIQRIKLSDKGVKLAPGVEYEWVVALVTDSTNRSSDLVSNGVIKRVEPDATLKDRIDGASPERRPAVFAEEGIWYDALAALSDRIESQPENAAWRDARADLLTQVGLDAAASADRAQ
jgi:allantoicase